MYAFIGDLHLGAKLPQMDYFRSLENFLQIIKHHSEECHCIFVVGDLFDRKLSVEECKFAAAFIVNLVCNGCGRNGKKHVPVHFIHGTFTHDNEQYEIFMPLLERLSDVEVLYTKRACGVVLENGVSVLYLPQEYGDVEYGKTFEGKYDIIVGHGPVSSLTKAPCKSTEYEILHSAEKLGEISKICVFGHYHGYTDFGNNVYYTGPWLRWKYGEDEERVFFFCDDEFNVFTVKNDIALKFETFHVYSPEELRIAVSKKIDHPERFIIHCNSGDLEEYHAIMNAYKKNQFIKYQIISEHKNEEESIDLVENVTSHPIVEPVPALIEYVKDKYQIDVTEEIQDYESRINKDKKEEQ